MEWLNIHGSTLRSPAFIGAEPIDRATWLCLLAFCANQENGGRIAGGRDWGDRRWQQVAGVTLKEVRRETELWTWENTDLVVAFYPLGKETEIRAKRLAGTNTATRRWHGGADSSATSSAGNSAICSADTEGKGREGKGIEPPPAGACEASATSPIVPTEDEVLAWARSWPGMPSVGIPPGIPEPWILDWLEYRTRVGQPPLGDWKRSAAQRFRSDWGSGHPKAKGQSGREQKGAAGPVARPESETARRIRLEQEVKAALQALAAADDQVSSAKALRDSGNPAGCGLMASAMVRWHEADERVSAAKAAQAAEGVAA